MFYHVLSLFATMSLQFAVLLRKINQLRDICSSPSIRVLKLASHSRGHVISNFLLLLFLLTQKKQNLSTYFTLAVNPRHFEAADFRVDSECRELIHGLRRKTANYRRMIASDAST